MVWVLLKLFPVRNYCMGQEREDRNWKVFRGGSREGRIQGGADPGRVDWVASHPPLEQDTKNVQHMDNQMAMCGSHKI